MKHSRNSLICIAACFSLLAATSGCAVKEYTSRDWRSVPLSEMIKRDVRTVAIVPVATVPDVNLKTYAVKYAPSKIPVVRFGGSHPAAFFVSAPIVVPIMIARILDRVARASDKIEVLPDDVAQHFERAMSKDIAGNALQEKLAEQVVTTGASRTSYAFRVVKRIDSPDQYDNKLYYQLPDSDRADMAIEVGVQSIWFHSREGTDPKNPDLSLYMTATFRVFWPADGTVMPPGTFSYVSRSYNASAWVLDNCSLLRQKIEAAYEGLAEQIIGKQFILYGCDSGFLLNNEACTLRAYVTSSQQIANSFSISKDDPFHPTLAWEAFPGDNIRAADSRVAWDQVSDVTYDLKVSGPELAYERWGLAIPGRLIDVTASQPDIGPAGQPGPTTSSQAVRPKKVVEHTIETKLEPLTKYCWSVRARFKIDGHVRTTEWSPYTDEYCFMTPEFQVADVNGDNAVTRATSPSLAVFMGGDNKLMTPEQITGKTFYTRANVWYDGKYHVLSTNYHEGTMLPLGSGVRIQQIVERENDPFADPSIRFVDDNGRSYTLIFKSRHAADDMTIRVLFSQYFTEHNPLFEGGVFSSLTPEEQAQVKLAKIEAGMSKAAVIMAYGYPPGHKTPSLENNKWIYWEGKRFTKTVYFIDDMVAHVQTW